MKTYVVPSIEFVDLRVEERLAGSVCRKPGSCDDDNSKNFQRPQNCNL